MTICHFNLLFTLVFESRHSSGMPCGNKYVAKLKLIACRPSLLVQHNCERDFGQY